MFEKWFGGNNKKEVKPSVEGVAHFDEGVLEEEKFDQKLDDIQENFKDNKVSIKNFHVGNRRKEDEGENWSAGVDKYLTKHEGSRKPEYKDLHSDWKEKGVFDDPVSKEEMSDDHLDANEEVNHGFEDGEHEEEEFVPENVPKTYEEWKRGKIEEDQDLGKAA